MKYNSVLMIIIMSPFLMDGACGRSVKRITNIKEVHDLDGGWSFRDSLEVSKNLVKSLAPKGNHQPSWLHRFKVARKRSKSKDLTCRILVDDFVQELTLSGIINTDELSTALEQCLMGVFQNDDEEGVDRGGIYRNITVIAGRAAFRKRIRKERGSQQMHTSSETRARLARELGANVMITGKVVEHNDVDEGGFLRKRKEFRRFEIIINIIDIETGQLLGVFKTETIKKIRG